MLVCGERLGFTVRPAVLALAQSCYRITELMSGWHKADTAFRSALGNAPRAGFRSKTRRTKLRRKANRFGTDPRAQPATAVGSAPRYFVNTSAITLLDGSTISSLLPTIAKPYGRSLGLLAVTLLGIGSIFMLFGTNVPTLALKPVAF
jgi:hypothetical protein